MMFARHRRFLSIYGLSLAVTVLLLAVVGASMGTAALVTLIILTAIEVTFSLDCALINAQVLRTMSPFWQRMFQTVGILIAVFGVRLVLPITIVALIAQLGFSDVITLALSHPEQYSAAMHHAGPVIAALGGMFLLMVFLDFLLGQVRNNPFAGIVRHLDMRGEERYLQIFIALGALVAVGLFAPADKQLPVLIAGSVGMMTYVAARFASAWFARRHLMHRETADLLARNGVAAFLYLELLDGSFSFDSVIGAFAVTDNVVLIAAGLGAGAVWVRSMTIDLLQKGTLRHYPYLGLGANLAVGVLGILLLVETSYELPELVTGGVGLVIIGASFIASVVHNHRAAKTGVLSHITLHNHRQ